MNIIPKQLNPNGSYSNINRLDILAPLDGHYQVADGVELSCGGFGELVIDNDVVVDFIGDADAWEAWKAEQPETESVHTMTLEEAILDKLTEIEYRQDLMALGLTEGGVGA